MRGRTERRARACKAKGPEAAAVERTATKAAAATSERVAHLPPVVVKEVQVACLPAQLHQALHNLAKHLAVESIACANRHAVRRTAAARYGVVYKPATNAGST